MGWVLMVRRASTPLTSRPIAKRSSPGARSRTARTGSIITSAAASEWDGGFRDDIAAFLDDALIDGAVEHGRPAELPPIAGIYYRAFVDPAGGVGADAYTLAIAHSEGETFIIDAIRGTRGKYDPVAVTADYAALCRQYRIGTVHGDRYSAEWVASAWSRENISYVPGTENKSQIYLESLPLFARGLVRLPDHPLLLKELRLLERHAGRSGRDFVDHPKNGHDDYSNAACGALRLLSSFPDMISRTAVSPTTIHPTRTVRAPGRHCARRCICEAEAASSYEQQRFANGDLRDRRDGGVPRHGRNRLSYFQVLRGSRMMALTHSQFALVESASNLLGPHERRQFLRTVRRVLHQHCVCSDDTVRHSIAIALNDCGIGVGDELLATALESSNAQTLRRRRR